MTPPGGASSSPSPRADLVLASASPRRTALLADWGIPHEIVVPEVEEIIVPGQGVVEQAIRIAVEKAEAVLGALAEPRRVLAADTIVAVGELQLQKPGDAEEAVRMLMSLAGREILVVTGVALARPGLATLFGAETTRLLMRSYDPAEARAYAATGEPLGKAGAFAIQGEGGRLVAARTGSFSNVVGLPRRLVLDLLAESEREPGAL